MSLKIAFLGAKDIGAYCFEYLLKAAPDLGFEITALRSREGKNGEKLLALAKENAIPILNSLDDLPEVDIIYSVQHHELLRQKDIDKAKKIALNLHLAPLPEYRGCNQFSFAIMDEAQEFGVTIHQMDAYIDNGAVLFEKRFPIPENCWVEDLHKISVEKGKEIFVETLANIASGNYTLKPQAALKQQKESNLYFRNQIEELKNIPLDLSEKEIAKRIRATMMPGFEPPYTEIAGKKIYFSAER